MFPEIIKLIIFLALTAFAVWQFALLIRDLKNKKRSKDQTAEEVESFHNLEE